VSGKYVIDVPPEAGPVQLRSQNPSVAIADKVAALRALHPAMSQALSDELLDLSKVDLSLSIGVTAGPLKGTVVRPGGRLVTTVQSLTVGTLTRVAARWYGFRLVRTRPPPPPGPPPPPSVFPPEAMLYNYDPGLPGFVEFNPASFAVDLVDATGASVLVPGLLSGVETLYSAATPLSCRLRFTNVMSVPYFVSDWLLLAG
jgi:hypothetical protein